MILTGWPCVAAKPGMRGSTVSAMNVTVTAALISGGWATAASALGYASNRATTRATIQTANANAVAALDAAHAAHAAQLWGKRAEAYLDTIGLIQRRLLARDGQPEAEDEADKVALSSPKRTGGHRPEAGHALFRVDAERGALRQGTLQVAGNLGQLGGGGAPESRDQPSPQWAPNRWRSARGRPSSTAPARTAGRAAREPFPPPPPTPARRLSRRCRGPW